VSCDLTTCTIWNECDKAMGSELKPACAINSIERAEIFECLDRLEYCSPKSEPWIKENAKSIRKLIQKL